MTVLDIESQINFLSIAEKVHILQRLVFDLTKTWPGIEKRPGVAGGSACIVRTRIPVWVLEGYRRLGWSEARILENYPTLRSADLVQAWAYVSAHVDEIEKDIRENQEA